jgi:hypothetical protein
VIIVKSFRRSVTLVSVISLLILSGGEVASAKTKAKPKTDAAWKPWLVVTDKSVGYPCLELPRELFPKVAPKQSGDTWMVNSYALLSYTIEFKTMEDALESEAQVGTRSGKAPLDGYPGVWTKLVVSSGEVIFNRYIEFEDELAVLTVALDDDKTSTKDLIRMTNIYPYTAKGCVKR